MFRDCGAHILDADVIAREIVEPRQPAWHDIIRAFGREILHENGQLNRKQLGMLIFQSPEKRQILEQIIHPRVIAEVDRQEAELRQTYPECVVVVDVPLLIEVNMHSDYHTIVVVYVPEEIQMQRVMQRDGLVESDARQRLAAQMPLAEKCAYATHIIDNSGPLDSTCQHVISLYQELITL